MTNDIIKKVTDLNNYFEPMKKELQNSVYFHLTEPKNPDDPTSIKDTLEQSITDLIQYQKILLEHPTPEAAKAILKNNNISIKETVKVISQSLDTSGGIVTIVTATKNLLIGDKPGDRASAEEIKAYEDAKDKMVKTVAELPNTYAIKLANELMKTDVSGNLGRDSMIEIIKGLGLPTPTPSNNTNPRSRSRGEDNIRTRERNSSTDSSTDISNLQKASDILTGITKENGVKIFEEMATKDNDTLKALVNVIIQALKNTQDTKQIVNILTEMGNHTTQKDAAAKIFTEMGKDTTQKQAAVKLLTEMSKDTQQKEAADNILDKMNDSGAKENIKNAMTPDIQNIYFPPTTTG